MRGLLVYGSGAAILGVAAALLDAKLLSEEATKVGVVIAIAVAVAAVWIAHFLLSR